MRPGITTCWPAHVPPDSSPMSTSRSAWSMHFGAHLRLLGIDVMLLEAIKIGATRYEHADHLSPDAAEHQPGSSAPAGDRRLGSSFFTSTLPPRSIDASELS